MLETPTQCLVERWQSSAQERWVVHTLKEHVERLTSE